MTKPERAKALALFQCKMIPGTWDKGFARAMCYLAESVPATVLTPAQKYGLDLMTYRYRRQLAGSDIEIPTEQPERENYLAAAEARRKAIKQANLF